MNFFRFSADLLIMQETHSTPEVENIWNKDWGGKALYSHGTSAARGIAVYATPQLFQKILNVNTDDEGRVIYFDILDNDQQVTFVALYAPNQDKPSFFRAIRENLKNRHENKIMIGDFNLNNQ